ncbi:MAG: tetratricopeptide repeat protein [Blastocatellia bacterium]|nr:tetratricopeptide repeat protein [Blastocatellia bacterium]
MIKKPLLAAAFLFVLSLSVFGQQRASDKILILPFENTSDKTEFNWVGESFAMSLSELLRVPTLDVVSNGERKLIQQRLRIPLANIPSIATALKISRESGATLLVTGRYNIIPEQEDTAATLSVTTRIIRVNEGRFLSEVHDGRQIMRDIVINDALANLQTVHGLVAYQVLYQRDRQALAYSQNEMVVASTKVPARAFEAYIKGLLTPPGATREIFFRNAMRIYSDTVQDGTFSDAALELGHLYLNQRKLADAVDQFERVVNANQQCVENARGNGRVAQCNDESFAEASFYIGLIRFQQGNFEQALGVLRPLADDLKLTSVYNTLGGIAIQASRAERKDLARSAALMNEGLELLRTAAESAPDDPAIRFNYAFALFLQGSYPEAVDQLRAIIAESPRDGEAYYLLSKALLEIKDTTAGTIDNQARTHLAAGNKYANLEREWAKTKSASEIALRIEQPQRRDFVAVVLSQRAETPLRVVMSEADNLLNQARTHFTNGNDEEAMAVVRRILVSEPMNAESYLILGKIHLRRGDREQAQGAFKTAIFWDNKLIDAHVALGRIHLERGECLQVKTFAASALEIDSENPDANALSRQADRCSK